MNTVDLLKCVVRAFLLLASAVTLAGQQPVNLTIRADVPGPVISRHVFGQFAEHLGTGIYGGVWVGPDSPIPNTRGIRNDVVQALRALQVPNVRWPGGCFADRYNWRDGIGPREKRPRRINGQWADAIETNAFGTHEFFDFIEQIGSEAYLSVNVGSGTPREAAEWVQYITSPLSDTPANERRANGRQAPWKIKFLGIGNENWGCGGGMTGDAYASEMKRFISTIENYHPQQRRPIWSGAAADPMLRIAGGPNRDEPDYTEAIMRAYGSRLDYGWNLEGISLHAYTFGKEGIMQSPATGFGNDGYAALLQNAYRMEDFVRQHSAIMDRGDAARQLTLAVDEWGNWLMPMKGTELFFLRQESSLRDGISAAINLNIFARHADRVRMANVAQMINVLQAMIMTDGEKMHLTPTYHVFRMYVPFQDATFLPVTLDAGTYAQGGIVLPRLDAIAARGKDGRVWLAVVNLHPDESTQVDVAVAGVSSKSGMGEVLTAPGIDSVNSFEYPDVVSPRPIRALVTAGRLRLPLPPRSVTVVGIQE